MTTNPNDPAMADPMRGVEKFTHEERWQFSPGLTKREYFAIQFAAAYMGANFVGNSGYPEEQIAERGVRAADALIATLNETSTSKQ